jgi:hypothetical protein
MLPRIAAAAFKLDARRADAITVTPPYAGSVLAEPFARVRHVQDRNA